MFMILILLHILREKHWLEIIFSSSSSSFFFFKVIEVLLNKKVCCVHDDEHTVLETITNKSIRNTNRL